MRVSKIIWIRHSALRPWQTPWQTVTTDDHFCDQNQKQNTHYILYTLSRRTILGSSVRLHSNCWKSKRPCMMQTITVTDRAALIGDPLWLSGLREQLADATLIPQLPPTYLPRNHHRGHSSYHTAVYIGNKGNPVSCCSVIDKQIAIWPVTICQHNIIAVTSRASTCWLFATDSVDRIIK
jgi:hypothetical protein